jgi:parvulin-like peptidyl-prolyl isomerase
MRHALLALLLMTPCGCDDDEPDSAADAGAVASASGQPRPLTSEQAAEVLAEVGEVRITLGEYVAALERMDAFERLRYQSPERRRKLLDELIDVELLAQEARRRGLDRAPETQERLRQMLRDELLTEVRKQLPEAASLPAAEVRRYYEEHRSEFDEPERRRVAHIVLASKTAARELLDEAKRASPAEWGRLVTQHSVDRKSSEGAPLELKGDLGIVGPPGDERGQNPKVPEALRAAVFEIDELGGVHDEVVEVAGRFHIVRLAGKSAARTRSFQEAERAIRVKLFTERLRAREAELLTELKQRFTVEIDEKALARVRVPKVSRPKK